MRKRGPSGSKARNLVPYDSRPFHAYIASSIPSSTFFIIAHSCKRSGGGPKRTASASGARARSTFSLSESCVRTRVIQFPFDLPSEPSHLSPRPGFRVCFPRSPRAFCSDDRILPDNMESVSTEGPPSGSRPRRSTALIVAPKSSSSRAPPSCIVEGFGAYNDKALSELHAHDVIVQAAHAALEVEVALDRAELPQCEVRHACS